MGSLPSLLLVFRSIPFNRLPCSEPGIGSSRSIAGLTMEEMFEVGFAGDLDLDLKVNIIFEHFC